MPLNTDQIKELRAKTGAGVMDAKTALEQSNGDIAKAEEWLKQKGLASAAKKSERET
jgi:elongation factor Ts